MKNKQIPVTSFDLMALAFDLTAELMDAEGVVDDDLDARIDNCLLYTSPSPRD